jgi:chaperonin GroEL
MKSTFSLSKLLTIDTEVLEKIEECIKVTLGPSGKNGLVFTKKQGLKFLTNGSLLIKSLEFSNHSSNILLKLLEQASAKTYLISGDGSTLTLLLTCHLLKNSFHFLVSGYNSIFLSNGLKKLAIFLNEKVLEFSNPVLTKENLFGLIETSLGKKVSSNIFLLLKNAIFEIARDNLILVEENVSSENEFEIVQGIELDKGFASSYFINNLKTFETIYENPYILITKKPIHSLEQIRDIIEYIKSNQFSLVIVAEEINPDILSALVLNNIQKKIKVVVIRYSSIKFLKTGILEDLALLTHSNYFSENNIENSEKFFSIQDLGQAKKIIIRKDKSTFIVSKFAKIITNRRINELSREALLSDSEYEKNLLKTRIARLSGKITKIKLGTSNQYELEEIKQKVESTINTIKSTLETGFLPGGGSFYFFLAEEVLNWSLLNLVGDEIFAGNIVFDSLLKPFQELVKNNVSFKSSFFSKNQNLSFSQIFSQLKKLGYPYAFDLFEQKIVNTFETNLIDSAKSIRGSLWNSMTIVSLIITTE